MILKDEAIILRVYPYGNTSRIMVGLSAAHGKLAVLVKGSQRERSGFLGQYDLFYTCEILFYAREQRNLHILRECCPLQSRSALREDWRACAAASYVAGVFDLAMPFGPAPHGLYGLLADTLDRLATRTPGPAFLPRFELLMLQELGLAPNWDACAKCSAPLHGDNGLRLDVAHGAALCEACSAGRGVAVSAAAAAALRRMRAGHPPAALPASVFREVRALMGGLLEHHADLPGRAREIAFQVLAAG